MEARQSQSDDSRWAANFCISVSLAAFVVCVYFHSLFLSGVFLVLACVFHWHKTFKEGIRCKIDRDNFPLQVAGLNPKDFMASNWDAMASNSGNETEGSEEPQIYRHYRYYHRPSGKYLFLSLAAKFWEYQDDVYKGDPFHAPLGGIVMPGCKCRTLVEVGREQAMANLEGPGLGDMVPKAQMNDGPGRSTDES